VPVARHVPSEDDANATGAEPASCPPSPFLPPSLELGCWIGTPLGRKAICRAAAPVARLAATTEGPPPPAQRGTQNPDAPEDPLTD
jgi:hypothetical protein